MLSYSGRQTSGITRGGKGDVCPRAQHFWSAKLRAECYE